MKVFYSIRPRCLEPSQGEDLNATAVLLPAFCCALVFDTPEGNGSAALDYPEGIRWTGDDIVDGEFLLFGERHYTVFLWYDGAWEASVRGVDL